MVVDAHFDAEDTDVLTRFIDVPPFSKWTTECSTIKEWVEYHMTGRVLNATAGKSKLEHDDEMVTNDINPERDADTHVDVAELSSEYEQSSFDTIIFDPPWSVYQSNLRYDDYGVYKESTEYPINIMVVDLPIEPSDIEGKDRLSHAKLAKQNFDYLLREGGVVIEMSLSGSCMPKKLGYDRVERVMFESIGEGKTMIGSVDRKR